MKDKSHIMTDPNSSTYEKVEYSNQRSTKFFAAKAVSCTKGNESQEVVTWKSAKSRVDVHDSKASFTINLSRIENEENIRKMNDLLRGKRDSYISTKNNE